MTRLARVIGVVAMLIAAARPAHAQSATAANREPPRVELTVGAGLFGGADLGARDAELRSNSTPPQDYRLFAVNARLTRSPLIDVRAAVTVSRRIAVEARVGMSRPEIRATLDSDAEGAAPAVVAEQVDQYVVDAGVVIRLFELDWGGLMPHVEAGGGYVRQRHESGTLIDEGRMLYVGGGVTRWLLSRPQGFVRALGLRASARAQIIDGGIGGSSTRAHGTLTGSVVAGF